MVKLFRIFMLCMSVTILSTTLFPFLYSLGSVSFCWAGVPDVGFLDCCALNLRAVLDFLIAQLCRSFGFASARFELRSPGFTRTEIRRNDVSFVVFHLSL